MNNLKNNRGGATTVAYLMVLAVCVLVGIAAVLFFRAVDNYHTNSSTQFETQGFTSPTTQVVQ